jgi:hypothetical protein
MLKHFRYVSTPVSRSEASELRATSRVSELQIENADARGIWLQEVVMFRIVGLTRIMMASLICCSASLAFAAEGGPWSVSRSTGEVWVTTRGAAAVSLAQEEILKPGETIRTGRSGRVLLRRGEETILVAPNTVVGLPAEAKDGLSTTILQQAGSILLDVEKRNVKHFEVETPYLAAVVKGTQFSVTVNAASTSVEVRRGQVEVADFKSGQVAQIVPGQTATVSANGKPGLSLSGTGPFNPIDHGRPRASSIEQIPVPKSGLSIPRNAGDGQQIHALGNTDKSRPKSSGQSSERQRAADNAPAKRNAVRISASLGEVRLDVHKATHGLAHGLDAAGTARRASTVWSNAQASANSGSSSNQRSSTGIDAAAATTSPVASSGASSVTAAASAVSASASGNGNDGAATGSGKGSGKGSGNSGNQSNNGNGNHGVGNGNGNGNAKH